MFRQKYEETYRLQEFFVIHYASFHFAFFTVARTP